MKTLRLNRRGLGYVLLVSGAISGFQMGCTAMDIHRAFAAIHHRFTDELGGRR